MDRMKNLIEPAKLAYLMEEPISYERITEHLQSDSSMTAGRLCKAMGIDPQRYYHWKNRQKKRKLDSAPSTLSRQDVIEPTGAHKKSYSAAEKFELLRMSDSLHGPEKTEFLRRFGLYQSDLDRWDLVAREAAVGALSQRKPRRDQKPAEQVEIEKLKKELQGQEKTIAKLAALVVIQKKVSEILGVDLES